LTGAVGNEISLEQGELAVQAAAPDELSRIHDFKGQKSERAFSDTLLHAGLCAKSPGR